MTEDRTLSRRQVLRGTGGVALALPFLPSLFPRAARAQAPGGPPRLLMFGRGHGGYGNAPYGTIAEQLPNNMELYPGHTISWGPLPRKVENGRTVVTRVVQGSSTVLTDRLIAKMNILRGFDDVASQGNHACSGFGAVYQRTSKDRFYEAMLPYQVPSVDQMVAWSPSYYKAGGFGIRCLQVHPKMGDSAFSRYWQNRATRTGRVDPVETDSSILDPAKLFDMIFAGAAPTTPTQPTTATATPALARKPLVDHVLEHYRLINQSNRRLSAGDRERLQAHMEMLSEVQRRANALSTRMSSGAACSKPMRRSIPTSTQVDPAEYTEAWKTYGDLIAAAIKCDVTRIAVAVPNPMGSEGFFANNGTLGWHGQCHGGMDGTSANEIVARSLSVFFEHVVLNVASKLDVEEADGKTYLDNSLITFTNDQGMYTHTCTDMFAITLGGAGGFFKTGSFVDYRNRTKVLKSGWYGNLSPGLYVNQLWTTVLDAMRIPRSEWSTCALGGPGYGPHTFSFDGSLKPAHYVPQVAARTGDKLPIITAS